MRFVIFSLFILMLAGCQTETKPTQHSTPSQTSEQSDHDEHEHGDEHTEEPGGHEEHDEHAEEPGGHDEHGDEHDEEEGILSLTPAQEKELKITTQVVVYSSGQSTGIRPGRIEADPDRRVLISSQVSGTLQQIYVQVGATLKAGASVALIASPEVIALQTDYHEAEVEADLARKELANKTELFRVGDDIQRPIETAALEVAQAEAQRDSAAARLESAVLTNDRLETLLSEGIAAKQQVEESRAERRALEASLTETETALKIAKNHQAREQRISKSRLNIKAETFPAEARLARASEQMRHARERLQQLGANPEEHSGLVVISSPISGTVIERASSRGELITPGEPVAVVVDSSRVWAWVDLQRSDLMIIEQGDPLELSLVDQPDKKAKGYLDYISPQLDEKSQTLRGRVVLTDPPQGFRLGAFVNAFVTNGSGDSSPAIPKASVQFVEGQTVVYVHEKDVYKRIPVSLGASVGENLVVASGVNVGDLVVVNNVAQLKSLDLSDKIGGHSH
jgi:RND family efflux transporter MFP subunit